MIETVQNLFHRFITSIGTLTLASRGFPSGKHYIVNAMNFRIITTSLVRKHGGFVIGKMAQPALFFHSNPSIITRRTARLLPQMAMPFPSHSAYSTRLISDLHHKNKQQQQLPHDMGGIKELFGSIHIDNQDLQMWEQQCHALFAVLTTKQYFKTDELRRSIEDLTPAQYKTWGYYEKWTAGMVTMLLDSKIISHQDLSKALFSSDDNIDPSTLSQSPRFQPGDKVRVKPYQHDQKMSVEWRRPHIRTPGYIYGVNGKILDICGQFGDPSYLAFGIKAPHVWLYRVDVSMADLWPEQSSSKDSVSVEIYEHWLDPSEQDSGHMFQDVELLNHNHDGRDCVHHDHQHISHHVHDHRPTDDHSHDARPKVETRAVHKEGPPRPGKDLFAALYSIVISKDIVTHDEVRSMMETLDNAGKNLNGASLVLQAWIDEDFKERLLQNPAKVAREIGIETSNPNAPTVLQVVKNTEAVHNLVVCTLCSCYPSGLLGIAPSWYKSAEFRSRAVREPRSVLMDFGTTIPSDQTIRVHDSTADHRYLVLPMRPKGTEGWSKERLRALITRDCMIGVTVPSTE
jgi:nitrile hydratase subunit alpha